MKRSLGAKTLVVPAPVLMVGTYDEYGRANLMAAAWGSVCCSKPPCVSIALRKATYTYTNLMVRRAFTVSIPSQDQVEVADYVGIYSGRDEDKFAALGLTAIRSDLVDAPLTEQFGLSLECELRHNLEIGLHTLFIGEVLDAKADDRILDHDGRVDLARLAPLVYAPVVREYFGWGARIGKAFSVGMRKSPRE
jgi:flavin reductase (DIM6/NTAB) family NADH-FMN oxidoreductase RutF